MQNRYGIHWFRRDLRVVGNSALLANWKKNNSRVVGLFIFDSSFLSREDFSHRRFGFFLKTLSALKQELQEIGSDLLVLDAEPVAALSNLIKVLPSMPDLISWSRDYEPFARARDERVIGFLREQNLPYLVERDHLILEPEEVYKAKPGDFYQVYSPFARKWLEQIKQPEFARRLRSQQGTYFEKLASGESKGLFSLKWKDLLGLKDLAEKFSDQLENFIQENQKHMDIEIPAAGSRVAYESMRQFSKKLQAYAVDRDIPSVDGTSGLSIFLKNGSLTTSQIFAELLKGKESEKYSKELIWREFYYHILYHCPRVESEAFIEKYRNIRWQNNENLFLSWCQGKTGYPIVDAGMRQLKQTGWMHNRVRMIVASFLVKDLLIDWRWGERYFMQMLLDGDLAPNNGGWQWSASTGCDPQPYFRIFNPMLQAAKFDPEGLYIKKFVPELAGLTPKQIHNLEYTAAVKNYQAPIVNHSEQREKALLLFKNI